MIDLRLGDCLEVMKELVDKSVDFVAADLPYGTTACKWDAVIPLEPMWELFYRIAKDDCVFALTSAQPFTTALIASNLKDFKYCWVWDKMVGRGHLVAKKRPMARHEDICIFYRKPGKYYPIMAKREKEKKSKEYKRTEIMGGESSGSSKMLGHRYPHTILSFSGANNQNKLHPTQKPVELMKYLIETYSLPGETVLDCCMGSGSTGVAALQLGRSFIGIERDPNYFAIAEARINAKPIPEDEDEDASTRKPELDSGYQQIDLLSCLENN